MLKKNKELLFKQAYEYGVSVNWDKYCILEFAESYYTSVEQIIKWIVIYIKENFKEEESNILLKK